jgi:hypothetical protein
MLEKQILQARKPLMTTAQSRHILGGCEKLLQLVYTEGSTSDTAKAERMLGAQDVQLVVVEWQIAVERGCNNPGPQFQTPNPEQHLGI